MGDVLENGRFGVALYGEGTFGIGVVNLLIIESLETGPTALS
jgi:hypothetical protein